MFYLVDLERSIRTGVVHYWKANKMGYTRDLDEAGLYEHKEAVNTVSADIQGLTVMVSSEQVKKINT